MREDIRMCRDAPAINAATRHVIAKCFHLGAGAGDNLDSQQASSRMARSVIRRVSANGLANGLPGEGSKANSVLVRGSAGEMGNSPIIGVVCGVDIRAVLIAIRLLATIELRQIARSCGSRCVEYLSK